MGATPKAEENMIVYWTFQTTVFQRVHLHIKNLGMKSSRISHVFV